MEFVDHRKELVKECFVANFDRDFRNISRSIRFAGILTILLSLALVVLLVIAIRLVINNPGAIGEFFGKIVHGFSEAAR